MEEDILLEETTPNEALEETGEEQQPTAEAEVPKYKVKYNGAEMELGVDELITNAQKGMNYDHVHEDLLKTRNTSKQTQTQLERLTWALNQFGYAGSPQEIADMLEAQRWEVEPEQVRRARELEEQQEQVRLEAEAARSEAENIRREAIFALDLAEIQRLNPNIKTLDELGETFFKLRAAGFGNIDAFELVTKSKATGGRDASGKEHMIPMGGGKSSAGLVDIPRSDLGFWRDSFPNDTPTKLKERYNRAIKRQN